MKCKVSIWGVECGAPHSLGCMPSCNGVLRPPAWRFRSQLPAPGHCGLGLPPGLSGTSADPTRAGLLRSPPWLGGSGRRPAVGDASGSRDSVQHLRRAGTGHGGGVGGGWGEGRRTHPGGRLQGGSGGVCPSLGRYPPKRPLLTYVSECGVTEGVAQRVTPLSVFRAAQDLYSRRLPQLGSGVQNLSTAFQKCEQFLFF